MEADPAQDLLRELLAPSCLDSEPSPGPLAQRQLRPLRCPRAGGRSLWPVCQDSVTILRLLQETEEGQARAPTPATQALGTCWEPGARRVSGPLTMARSSKNKQTPGSHKRRSRDPPGAPAALPQRRPRKQPKPRQGAKQVDPGFKGVTLKFQIKADSSLQISPTYSLASSSQTEGAASTPTRAAEPNSRGGEALGPRCCASCRTHRTPLWRDAEDGTPLCNACGIRSLAQQRELGRGTPNQSICGQCGV